MISVEETEALFQVPAGEVSQNEGWETKKEENDTGNPLLDDEIRFVRQLVDGNNWNRKIYGKGDNRCIYLNGVRVNIDKKFLPAFQIVALTA